MRDRNRNWPCDPLFKWFMRKTTRTFVRRIRSLPLFVGTDIGKFRDENQDRAAVLLQRTGPNKFILVAALCDGMGGMAEGSACASLALSSFLSSCILSNNDNPLSMMNNAVNEANETVFSIYGGRGGSTLSVILMDSTKGFFGINVGDSRIYKFKSNSLEQITIDDTMAAQIKNGKDVLLKSNELLQFIGVGEGIQPHAITLKDSFDSFLITSDGIHYLDKKLMEAIIQNADNAGLAMKRLIDIANWCGGRDNASALLIQPISAELDEFSDIESLHVWDPFGELQIIIPDKDTLAFSSQNVSNGIKREIAEQDKEKVEPKSRKTKKRQVKKKGNEKFAKEEFTLLKNGHNFANGKIAEVKISFDEDSEVLSDD